MPGIYIHIPYCKQACSYCDFHFSTNLGTKHLLVASIVKELKLRHQYLKNTHLESIYFGGGTPSLLSVSELESIFETIQQFFSINATTEITLEVNPDDVFEQNLSSWKKLGFNRLSIGLQSFNKDELIWMNRAHNAEQSVTSVLLAQNAGFDNITIDLIYGSKFQNLSNWESTLIKALSLNTQHISSYNLTIEDKTVLGQKNASGKEPPVNDDLSSKQFLLMSTLLNEAGFIHYEISNFAKPGFIAKHNSNYWLQKHYLGLGPSAHSFNGVSRQWNIKNNNAYIKAINENTPYFEKEELTLNDRFNEYILTHLRTLWGCDAEEIKLLFGQDIQTHFLNQVAKKKVDFEINTSKYTLTENARLFADGIAADFFIQ